jgi:TRAP-type C4-dicarboxylate transport system substrate-binding protein
MTKLTRALAAVTFGAMAFTATASAIAQEVKWTYLTILPPTHSMVAPVIQAFDRIKERSGGKFVIQTSRYTETPHKPQDGMSVLRDGLADMSEWYAGYVTNTHPLLAAAELPYLPPKFVDTTTGIAAFKRAWSAPSVAKALDATMDKFKIRIAVRTYLEPIHAWSNAKIEKPFELGGRKMRANTPENGDMINAIGGVAQFMPITDVYPAAQRNVISGLYTSSNAVLATKLDEVTKFGYVANTQWVSGGYLVAKASHDKLPPDLKKIYDEEMAATDKYLFDWVPKSDEQGIKQLAAKGVEITTVSQEDYAKLRKIAEEKVWSAWKKRAGPDADKVLAEVIAAIGPL